MREIVREMCLDLAMGAHGTSTRGLVLTGESHPPNETATSFTTSAIATSAADGGGAAGLPARAAVDVDGAPAAVAVRAAVGALLGALERAHEHTGRQAAAGESDSIATVYGDRATE